MPPIVKISRETQTIHMKLVKDQLSKIKQAKPVAGYVLQYMYMETLHYTVVLFFLIMVVIYSHSQVLNGLTL